jgi:AcrR family transcriptional regulator
MKTSKVFTVPTRAGALSDETRSRITEAARSQFLRFGLTPVTTDQIATAAGISKATLYKYFPSKEELFREVVVGLLKEVEAGVDGLIAGRKFEFGEKLAEILRFMGIKLAQLGGIITLDMQRSAPTIWKEVRDFRRERIFAKLKLILEEGRRSGVFRKDVDQDFLILLYATIIQEVMNPAALIPFSLSFAEAFRMIVEIMLSGILTEKGRAQYLSARAGHTPEGRRSWT